MTRKTLLKPDGPIYWEPRFRGRNPDGTFFQRFLETPAYLVFSCTEPLAMAQCRDASPDLRYPTASTAAEAHSAGLADLQPGETFTIHAMATFENIATGEKAWYDLNDITGDPDILVLPAFDWRPTPDRTRWLVTIIPDQEPDLAGTSTRYSDRTLIAAYPWLARLNFNFRQLRITAAGALMIIDQITNALDGTRGLYPLWQKYLDILADSELQLLATEDQAKTKAKILQKFLTENGLLATHLHSLLAAIIEGDPMPTELEVIIREAEELIRTAKDDLSDFWRQTKLPQDARGRALYAKYAAFFKALKKRGTSARQLHEHNFFYPILASFFKDTLEDHNLLSEHLDAKLEMIRENEILSPRVAGAILREAEQTLVAAIGGMDLTPLELLDLEEITPEAENATEWEAKK